MIRKCVHILLITISVIYAFESNASATVIFQYGFGSSWMRSDNYQDLSQTNMTLLLNGFSPASFQNMLFSETSIGHTWTIERATAAQDLDTVIPLFLTTFSIEPISYNYLEFGWVFGSNSASTGLSFFDFRDSFQGHDIEWLKLTLTTYSTYRSPNPSAYCIYALCESINNLDWDVVFTFGNNEPTPTPAAEPSSCLFLILGILGLSGMKRRKN
jgi:hypothetical protein